MCGIFTRPQTKSIMVLRRNDDPFGTCFFCNAAPLTAIYVGWTKNIFRFCSFTPFFVCKSVWSKMNEEIKFHVLPFELLLRGNRAIKTCLSKALQRCKKKYEK